jgi:hypothetical protein
MSAESGSGTAGEAPRSTVLVVEDEAHLRPG